MKTARYQHQYDSNTGTHLIEDTQTGRFMAGSESTEWWLNEQDKQIKSLLKRIAELEVDKWS